MQGRYHTRFNKSYFQNDNERLCCTATLFQLTIIESVASPASKGSRGKSVSLVGHDHGPSVVFPLSSIEVQSWFLARSKWYIVAVKQMMVATKPIVVIAISYAVYHMRVAAWLMALNTRNSENWCIQKTSKVSLTEGGTRKWTKLPYLPYPMGKNERNRIA